VFRESGA
jgi:Cilia- and flagella-associated protein 91